MGNIKIQMKFATAAALVGIAAAVQSHKAPSAPAETGDEKLAQLLSTALAGAPPGEINEPDHKVGNENQVKTTDGKTKNYRFRWKYACAFTKWTPTNQWMHDQQTKQNANGDMTTNFHPEEMTLERFGFIGTEKKCYWGMTAVFWVTPLKITQIKPS